MIEVYGRMKVERGAVCSNPGYESRWTTPCCYVDVQDRRAVSCPSCGAPIRCTLEQQPVAVCTIPDW